MSTVPITAAEDKLIEAIKWMEQHRVSAPNRPWFCYFSTPAVRAPHHAPAEWINKYQGTFDAGWDVLKEDLRRTTPSWSVIPEHTTLTMRPEEIPAWSEYPERYRPVAATDGVFCGFLAHTDHHISHCHQRNEQQERDTLIIYLSGDNGASAEGTIHGAWSAPSFQNGVHEDQNGSAEHIDFWDLKVARTIFNVGWAWALDFAISVDETGLPRTSVAHEMGLRLNGQTRSLTRVRCVLSSTTSCGYRSDDPRSVNWRCHAARECQWDAKCLSTVFLWATPMPRTDLASTRLNVPKFLATEQSMPAMDGSPLVFMVEFLGYGCRIQIRRTARTIGVVRHRKPNCRQPIWLLRIPNCWKRLLENSLMLKLNGSGCIR